VFNGDVLVNVIVALTSKCWSHMTCRQLLESVTCYDIMPRKTCVVVIDSELPVRLSWGLSESGAV